jgi:hypothetical protein
MKAQVLSTVPGRAGRCTRNHGSGRSSRAPWMRSGHSTSSVSLAHCNASRLDVTRPTSSMEHPAEGSDDRWLGPRVVQPARPGQQIRHECVDPREDLRAKVGRGHGIDEIPGIRPGEHDPMLVHRPPYDGGVVVSRPFHHLAAVVDVEPSRVVLDRSAVVTGRGRRSLLGASLSRHRCGHLRRPPRRSLAGTPHI